MINPNQFYIENSKAMSIVHGMFEFRYRRDLKERLTKQIKSCRGYLAARRNNGLPNMNSWDCGRQDAYYDMVEDMFRELEILSGAYQLSNGKATKLKKAMDRALGLDQYNVKYE